MEEQKLDRLQELNGTQGYLPKERVTGWRVWLVSFAFAIFHYTVLNLAAIIVACVMLIASSTDITDVGALESLLVSSQLQNYASILMSLVCCPAYLIYLHLRGEKYKGRWGGQKLTLHSAASAILAILGSLGLVSVLIIGLQMLSGRLTFVGDWLEAYDDLAQMIIADDGNIIVEFLGTVCFVPVAEELLFRGIILGELRLRYSDKTSVLIQAVLFGIFHMNPIQSLYTFIPGLVLGILYCRTNNIMLPIMGHMVFNFFGGLLYSLASETILNVITMVEIFVAIYAIYLIVQFFFKANQETNQKDKSYSGIQL